jgi:hypothetical protein
MYKYNIMDIMASMISYSWLKFTDILLFTMCLVILVCIQTSNIDFSILKDQFLLPPIEVSCIWGVVWSWLRMQFNKYQLLQADFVLRN